MTDFLTRIQSLSPNRLALLALDLHDQVERSREPVAIVGVGCRFPGNVHDPEGYWRLLAAGQDATGPVPASRWDVDAWFDADVDAPGRISVRRGGFLDAIDGFDAAFFGISPREALTMDPQQRLALEVAWETIEDAGISADTLVGTRTGVFLGVCNGDYGPRLRDRGAATIDGYIASGCAPSVASGRISYTFGFRGPALTIDTACSSSLVAIHEAVKSLRSGESDLALAGGVNLILMPEVYVALAKAHMLSPDGRCRAFDAAANGFARGEGCGFVALKRLSDALEARDAIVAVIRGSAINHDGRSGGLTVPSGPAQEAVIRAAVADAGLTPAAVGYVEAHGTGTTLGDPIEIRALANVYGRARTADAPLLVGSAKTNFGHLEAAAGVAGLIKAALAIRHRRIPPHLHLREPSPHIPWAEIAVRVPAAGAPWTDADRCAGVSSFGFSGTNAHIILGQAPAPDEPAPAADERPAHVAVISARSPGALRTLAKAMADDLERGSRLGDVAHALACGRAHLPHRVAVVAGDEAAAVAAFRDVADGRESALVRTGTAQPSNPPAIAMLCPGGGAQYPGMARDLYRIAPEFRAALDRCSSILEQRTGRALLPSLLAIEDPAAFDDATLTHPALFAVEWSLAQLWAAWGIEPAVLAGHSLGEFVAATLAGVMPVEDALWLVAERARLVQGLPAGGLMCAIMAPTAQVLDAVAQHPGLEVAAINGPEHVVVTGDTAAVAGLQARFEAAGIRCQRLHLAQAFHSARLDPILDDLERAAERIRFEAPKRPLVSNITGRLFGADEVPDARYWRRHARATVRFGDGMAALAAVAPSVYLEIGPHPVLLGMARPVLAQESAMMVPSLRRGQADWPVVLDAVASLHVAGAPINWTGFHGGEPRARVPLPAYPFERRVFWVPNHVMPEGRLRDQARAADPALGTRLPTAAPGFERTLGPDAPPFLAGHRVHDAVVTPGPAMLALAIAAIREVDGVAPIGLADVEFMAPMILPSDGRVVQIQLAGPTGRRRFEVHSRAPDQADRWVCHARGVQGGASTRDTESWSTAAARCVTGQSPEEFYTGLAGAGITIAPGIRAITSILRGTDEAVVTIDCPPALADGGILGSAMLVDAALHALAAAAPPAAGEAWLLAGVARIEWPSDPSRIAAVAARVEANGAERLGDVVLYDQARVPVGHLGGLLLKPLGRDSLPDRDPASWLHRLVWKPQAPNTPVSASVADLAGTAERTFEAVAAEVGIRDYRDLLPALNQLAAAYLSVACSSLGLDPRAMTEAAGRAGVRPEYLPLLKAVEPALADSRASADPERLAAELVRRFPAHDAEVSILRRCGPRLADVFTGRTDPVSLLFPGGALTEARKLYVESPFARTYNRALASAVVQAINGWPLERPIRILEIGAGTGGTTEYLLPVLEAHVTEYTFTDVSPHFLAEADRRWGSRPGFRTRLLDIERRPEEQGLIPGSFDLVIAANVLHATRDLDRTIGHARALLRRGGLLVALEGTVADLWVTLTFGLTSGWWLATDDRRGTGSPLAGRDTWRRLLVGNGCEAPAFVPALTPTPESERQVVIVTRAAGRTARTAEPWTLIADDEDPIARHLASRLTADGCTVRVASSPEAVDTATGPLVYLKALSLRGGVDLTDADIEAIDRAAGTEALEFLRRAAARSTAAPCWLITRGAQAVPEDTRVAAPAQAPLWGLGRVFALEHPDRFGGLIDLDPAADPFQAAQDLFDGLTESDECDQVAFRAGRRLAPTIEPMSRPVAPTTLDRNGSYLITGGLGGIGLALAEELGNRGAGMVILMGRNGILAAEDRRRIERTGAKVQAIACDVADEAALRAALSPCGDSWPPLRGALHAAAAISHQSIQGLSSHDVRSMYRAKVAGTVALTRVLRSMRPEFLVLFSSTTAVLGVAGFAHYAAANGFLDAWAGSGDLDWVTSIDWGTWEMMRLASEADQQRFEAGGLRPMPLQPATDILVTAGLKRWRSALVGDVDWTALRTVYEARRPRPIFGALGTTVQAVAPAPQSAGSTLGDRLAAAVPDRRRGIVADVVAEEVRGVLRMPAADPVAGDRGFFELGMDSLMSVELKNRLERRSGLALPSTLTFNYPSPGAVADYLLDRLTSAAPAPVVEAGPAPSAVAASLEELSDQELEAALAAKLRALD